MIWRINLLGNEVRSRVLRVVVDHLSLAKCRCKRNVIFFILTKNSNACIFHPLCGIDLKPACIIAAGASMSFLRAAFRAPVINTFRLNEEGAFVRSFPFLLKDTNFRCGYLWYLQRQPPCRDETSKPGSVHDPDLNDYFCNWNGRWQYNIAVLLTSFSANFLMPNF